MFAFCCKPRATLGVYLLPVRLSRCMLVTFHSSAETKVLNLWILPEVEGAAF